MDAGRNGKSSGGGSSSAGSGSSSGTPKPVAAGQFGMSPTVLNFGQVTVGTAKTQAGTLTAGSASITLKSADWSGTGFSVSGISFPTTIPAGQSVHFKVTFAPQTAGSSSGAIKFVSNADNTPQARFNGNGTQTAAHSVTLTWHSPAASVVGYKRLPQRSLQGSIYQDDWIAPSQIHLHWRFSREKRELFLYDAVNKKGKESKYSNRSRSRFQTHNSIEMRFDQGIRSVRGRIPCLFSNGNHLMGLHRIRMR